MKYLKYPLFVLLGLILIYGILCLIGPKDMDVVKSIEIDAPAPIIFNLTNSLKQTELWNEWTLSDSTIVVTYNGISSGVGAESSWESTAYGKGSQKILESVLNKQVKSELTFHERDGQNYADININPEGGKTKVSYSFDGTPFSFIFRGFALVVGMKKMMHTNYEKSLNNIKAIAEKRAIGIYDGYDIKEKVVDERHFIMNRQEVNLANIQQFYASNLGSLFGKVQASGVEMKGMPCGLFFKEPDKNNVTDMAAAIPVATPISIEGAGSFSIAAQKAITLDFYGDYNKSELGHLAIDKYMKDRNYLLDPPMIEEYVTDPTTEKDPNKWLTKLTYYYSMGQ